MAVKTNPKINHFWRITNEATGGGTLHLNGVIAEETWFGDEITPAIFKQELAAINGNLTVWINSPGGDVFAASQIYTMLKEYPHTVTVKIDGIAASAASVIAMAGEVVLMSPTAMLMIHNPITFAFGDATELEKSIALLEEVKEAIINAYEAKTGLERKIISKLMDNETWFNAKKATELGFADSVLYGDPKSEAAQDSFIWDKYSVKNSIFAMLPKSQQQVVKQAQKINDTGNGGVDIGQLEKRLNLLNPRRG